MGDVIYAARRLFLRRRCEALIRYVRHMRDGAPPAGRFSERIDEDAIFFAIRLLPDLAHRAKAEKRVPLTLDGLPDPRWIAGAWNLIGDVYPDLPRPYRDQFLRGVIGWLDGLKHEGCARRHVRLLRDPMLIGDVVINRREHFPGVDDEAALFGSCPTDAHLWRLRPDAINGFWHCLPVLMRGAWCADDVRRLYFAEFPHIVDRSIDFVAAYVFDKAREDSKGAEPRQPTIDAVILQKFDRSLFSQIRNRVVRRQWTYLA